MPAPMNPPTRMRRPIAASRRRSWSRDRSRRSARRNTPSRRRLVWAPMPWKSRTLATVRPPRGPAACPLPSSCHGLASRLRTAVTPRRCGFVNAANGRGAWVVFHRGRPGGANRIESPHDGQALPGPPNSTDAMPDSIATTNTRHIELHFATDDEAIELDVADEPAGADLLLDALEADDVSD